jgi:SAM-dependent methyltransferase
MNFAENEYEHPITFTQTGNPSRDFAVACASYEADLSDKLPADCNAKVLDIGCGWGQFLWFLRQKGYTTLQGIDLGSRQVEFCRSKQFEAEQCANPVSYLDEREKTYDLVTMHHVIEHMSPEDGLRLLRAIRTALKPGGRAIVQTPNMSAVSAVFCRFIEISHCTGYSESNLHQLMGLAGFDGLHVFGSRTPRIKTLKRGLWVLLQKVERSWWRAMLIAELGTDAPKILSKNLYISGTKP